jgi:hypothetical protein
LASPFNEKPVKATTTPRTVTKSKATNLRNMSKSLTLVLTLVDTQLRNVTIARPTSATILLIHGLMSCASAPRIALVRYSPIIMLMMAALPGLSTNTATHVKRKPANSPKILAR